MNDIQIRKMTYGDIPLICKADEDESESFITYLKNNLDNQENKKCSALLALYDDQIAGYVFLYYECKWGGLKDQGLPGVYYEQEVLGINASCRNDDELTLCLVKELQ